MNTAVQQGCDLVEGSREKTPTVEEFEKAKAGTKFFIAMWYKAKSNNTGGTQKSWGLESESIYCCAMVFHT